MINKKRIKSLETDLVRIKKLSEENEGENWGFRSFLKSCNFPAAKIDAMVIRVHKTIAAQINCNACRNCCKAILPTLKEKDIEKMAKGLEIPEPEFIEKYLENDEFGAYTFNQSPCPFLENNRCTVKGICPTDCRTYPNLNKKGFIRRLSGVIHSCSVCPIAYNVYEAVKKEIWEMDAIDTMDTTEPFDEY
ncbi:MAG: YkgJ family cysteine cluster protein [bacterium]|nr:YkgJ family cysteine cluster protein [bacterium]